jgi:hemerythrin
LESGKEDINFIEIIAFAKNWLQEHILGLDSKYADQMNQNGIY